MEWKYTAETNERPKMFEQVIVYHRIYDPTIKQYFCYYDLGLWISNGKYWELDSSDEQSVPDEEIYAWARFPKVEEGHE